MEKKKISSVTWICIAIVAVLVVIVCAVYFSEKSKAEQVDGTYTCTYASTSSDGSGTKTSVDVSMIFDGEEMEFQETWNDTVFSTGTYSYDKGRITVTTDATDSYDSEKMYYYVDGDALIPEDFIYEGTVPDGDTFDAEFVLSESGTESTAVFFADGTFVIRSATETTSSEVSGTYVRNGNIIERTREDGEELTGFYIYGDKLVGAFYQRQ